VPAFAQIGLLASADIQTKGFLYANAAPLPTTTPEATAIPMPSVGEYFVNYGRYVGNSSFDEAVSSLQENSPYGATDEFVPTSAQPLESLTVSQLGHAGLLAGLLRNSGTINKLDIQAVDASPNDNYDKMGDALMPVARNVKLAAIYANGPGSRTFVPENSVEKFVANRIQEVADQLAMDNPRAGAVVGGRNVETGEFGAACSSTGGCRAGNGAEGNLAKELSPGDPSKVQFGSPFRPSTGQPVNVCSNCQGQFSPSQFPAGTGYAPSLWRGWQRPP
jgi:hypothetical protein